ncbi:hypothetical protein BKA57DRAFT_510561 [Linnemannia elongata]|nr:hypothetical protein BKA57DRAFT_510561 [Linnemannia elongata]
MKLLILVALLSWPMYSSAAPSCGSRTSSTQARFASHLGPSAGGCFKGYCWATCDMGWCYTTMGKSQDGNYVECEEDGECDKRWNCAEDISELSSYL